MDDDGHGDGHEHVVQFVHALVAKDEASALSFLESGRVTIRSCLNMPDDSGGIQESIPVLFLAVECALEQVVRSLVRLGADIEVLHTYTDGITVTPAGHAIRHGNVAGLKLCHDLAGCMTNINGTLKLLSGNGVSGVDCAIVSHQPTCLEYLLDNVFQRPVRLSYAEMTSLSTAAIYGSRIKPVYMVFEARGFNFKLLEEAEIEPEGDETPMTLADILLSSARKSGNSGFMRYIVNDLGLVSTAGRLHETEAFVDANLTAPLRAVAQPDAALGKFECAACEAVGATKVCTGCRVARYCSKECSKRHWKTGGHKIECKELQRHATLTPSSSAGPSQP